MRAVQYIRWLHTVAVQVDFSRLIVGLGRHIPQLENMKALLGANGHTDNRVFGILRYHLNDGGSSVPLEDLVGSGFHHLDTICTTVNIGPVLPQRKKWVLH